jgi:transposase
MPPFPPSRATKSHGQRYSPILRAQCLTLLMEGYSYRKIEEKLGIPESTQKRIKQRAFARGFYPEQDLHILNYYVEDGARSNRPKEISLAREQRLIDSVKLDRAGREKSNEVLTYDHTIGRLSALRIFHSHGLSKVKPIRKPGLNAVQRASRLIFCLDYKD